jgi:beta-glucanase (GH16 family)
MFAEQEVMRNHRWHEFFGKQMKKNELAKLAIDCARKRRGSLVLAVASRAIFCAVFLSALLLLANASRAQTWGEPVWSDEFNSNVAGSAPDASNWIYDIGAGGWGNQELETYCSSVTATAPPCDPKKPNAFHDGTGHLVIQARRVSDDPAPTGVWTSARIRTTGLRDFQYGRMEACMKLPVGAGLWPAFWMMGTQAKWPIGGEIDIMENIPATGGSAEGLGPTRVEGTIHGPSTSAKGIFSLEQVYELPNGQRIDDENPPCHKYGAILSPFMIQMYVDDWSKPYYIRTAADVPPEGRWVFNAPFYFILNLAVGGEWPGPPDKTTPGVADVLVDYVRVYKAANTPAPKMTWSVFKAAAASDTVSIIELRSKAASRFVYVSCATDEPAATCTVDTANSLNKSVVDFRTTDTQRATVRTTRPPVAERANKTGRVHVTVTAHTVSGEESKLTFEAE